MAGVSVHLVAAFLLSLTASVQGAVLYWITPRSGSLAGGTRVHLHGAGFSTDQYSVPDVVFIGKIQCDVDWFTVKAWKLECITRPHPTAKRGDTVPREPTTIISGRIKFSTAPSRYSYQEFQYRWSHTPHANNVFPLASVAGSIVQLLGRFLTSDGTWLERITVGQNTCNRLGISAGDLHTHCGGSSAYWSRLCCRVEQGIVPGSYNITSTVSNYGRSFNASDGLTVSRRGGLRMYENFATITKVTPTEGSREGGTVVTIEGSGFGFVQQSVTVSVGGVACRVTKVEDASIECVTGRPDNLSPVLRARQPLAMAANISTVPLFPGNRGTSIKRFSFYDPDLSVVYNNPDFPLNPTLWEHSESFGTQRLRSSLQALSRRNSQLFEAYFVPPLDGSYVFHVTCNNICELWFSESEDPNGAKRIAYVDKPLSLREFRSTRANWDRSVTQRSQKITLVAGGHYFMRSAMTVWTDNNGFVEVGVHLSNTLYTYEQTYQSLAEVQSINIQATNLPEKHTVSVVTDRTTAEDTDSFQVTIAGRTTAPLLATNVSKSRVVEALYPLLAGECQELATGTSLFPSAQFDFFDLDSFERAYDDAGMVRYDDKYGSEDKWLGSPTAPSITSLDSYCGHSFLRLHPGTSINFRKSSHVEELYEQHVGWVAPEFPHVCTAFRIPPGVGVWMVVKLIDHGWFAVTLSDNGQPAPYATLARWTQPSGEPLPADNRWHYSCYNMDSGLTAGTFVSSDNILIEELGFRVAAPVMAASSYVTYMDVDEFSVSSVLRNVAQTSPPVHFQNVPVSNFSVDVTSSVSADNTTEISTVYITYQMGSCNFQTFPLLTATTSSSSVTATPNLLQTASQAVAGGVRVKLFNGQDVTMLHSTTADELKALLESLPGVGRVAVAYTSHDYLRCSGGLWKVTFESQPGDLAPLAVTWRNVTGTAVKVDVKDEVDGGLFLAPIPGDMLMAVEEDAQVTVTVNDIPSACSATTHLYAPRLTSRTACAYTYTWASTPNATSASPPSGSGGDTLTIAGGGFDTNATGNEVLVGNRSCVVTSATETQLQCRVPSLSAGPHVVSVRVPAQGFSTSCRSCSAPPLVFTSTVALTAVSPSSGSHRGGTTLSLAGHGFPEAGGGADDVAVLVGGVTCRVTAVQRDAVQCVTGATVSGGAADGVDVVATVTRASVASIATLPASYSYAVAKTPALASVSVTSGSGGGGTSLTIAGDLKIAGVADVEHVKIGDSLCKVSSASSAALTCTTSPHRSGTFPVSFLRSGDGLAVSTLTFTYRLDVTAISHVYGSLLGGQMLRISGLGFQASAQLQVRIGRKPCAVETVTSTAIECRTPSSRETHQVTNNADHAVYGWGYAWDSDKLLVKQGDSVHWSWTGSPFASLRGVTQVATDAAIVYDGSGFRSNRSTEGDFTATFTKLGTFYYVSEGFGHIGFRGSVTVQPLASDTVDVGVTLNGIAAVVTAAAVAGEATLRGSTTLGGGPCGDVALPPPPSPPAAAVLRYTYSRCHTPLVSSVTPALAASGGAVTLHGSVLPLPANVQHVTLLIDAVACTTGSSSNGLPAPRAAVSTATESAVVGGASLTCNVPFLTAGFYRLRLHVESLGWGFVADRGDEVLVGASFSVDVMDPPQGSQLGGTRLVIPGSGFSGLASSKNQVFIGNMPCDVISVAKVGTGDPHGSLVCVTRPVVDDGYSSVILPSKPLAYWRFDLQRRVVPNSGSLGMAVDGTFDTGSVWRDPARPGLHTNPSVPRQSRAAVFNGTRMTVPFNQQLYSNASFGVALWLKLEKREHSYGHYRQVMASSEPGAASRGFSLWITPCGELELWLASGVSQAVCLSVGSGSGSGSASSPQLCDAVTLRSTSPAGAISECQNRTVPGCVGTRCVTRSPAVSAGGGDVSQLPIGAWSVYSQAAPDLTAWTYVSFGFEPNAVRPGCSGVDACSGYMVLGVGGMPAARTPTSFLPPLAAGLEVGGSDQVGRSDPPLPRATLPYEGRLDEVAMYDRPLSDGEARRQHHYGISDEQPIYVTVGGEDRRGTGVTPEVVFPQVSAPYTDILINWDAPDANTVRMNETDRLVFKWTELNDVVQVSLDAFSRCDATAAPVRTWSALQDGGEVVVSGLANGRAHYFISSAYSACSMGVKRQVVVGHQQSVDWRIGVRYSDLVVRQGTGLLFTWDTSQTSGTVHNVVELQTRAAIDECDSSDGGGAVLQLHSHPGDKSGSSATGRVEVTGLTIGWHYFVCSVPGHCNAGMKIAINVLPELGASSTGTASSSAAGSAAAVQLPWRVQQYSLVRVDEEQPLNFQWDGFHSLHEVHKAAYDSCDVVSRPVVEWARASVASSLSISNLTAGRHYFLCSVAGHCLAGMKVEVDVRSKSLPPPLKLAVAALCGTPASASVVGGNSFCSFQYAQDSTPVVQSISPSHGLAGTAVNITGRMLEMPSQTPGAVISHMLVTVGNALCDEPRLLDGDVAGAGLQLVQCTLLAAESGSQAVSVVNTLGKALYKPVPASPLSTATFTVDLVLSGLSPASGSLNGGTTVTITGTGFTHVKSAVSVSLGGVAATVVHANASQIQVKTPPVGNQQLPLQASTVPVVIKVGQSTATASQSFTYDPARTMLISSTVHPSPLPGQISLTTTTSIAAGRSASLQISPSVLANMVCSFPATAVPLQQVQGSPATGMIADLQAGAYTLTASVAEYGLAIWPSAGDDMLDVDLSVSSLAPLQMSHGGGEVITIVGSGFPGSCSAAERTASAPFSVLVCGEECTIASHSHAQIRCTAPASPTARANGTRTFAADEPCPVTVVVGDRRADAASGVVYASSLTSVVTAVSPRRGGTAGGTVLTIAMQAASGVGGGGTAGTTVSVDGADCAVTFVNASVVQCRTGQHRTTLAAAVRVHTPGRGRAVEQRLTALTSSTGVEGSGYFQYVDLWSSVYTWGGKAAPAAGESVSVQRGQTLLLDAKTPELNLVIVQGNLIFDDSQDVLLQAKYIFIHGGRLQVGTEVQPFKHRAVIRLVGHVRDPELPIYGAKVLALRQGYLELYGQPNKRTWTRLAKTAQQNDTQLYLQDSVDWKHGDSIVLAPTGKDTNETEELFVNGTSSDGHIVYLGAPLSFTHHGETEHVGGGHSIEIRAEVGLLSHNVIVEGSVSDGFHTSEFGGDQYGSQIMVHRAGTNTTQVRLSNVEVRHAGQAFRLGRYAVHFHLSGNLSNSWVRHCSIHHSFNRAITAHGVHGMLFEGNVAYDIKGHTFFIEDGIETENRYLYNLGLLTRGSSSLLNTDQIPATFWITNPNNIFIGNAAAGSRAYGFWYDLDKNSFGPSFSKAICPNHEKMGVFMDNVAHSNAEFGLRIWERYEPTQPACSGKEADAFFYRLTSYANGIHGVELSVVSNVKLVGFKVADNRDNGIEIQEGVGNFYNGTEIRDSLIISYTNANKGNPQTGGIKLPNRRRMTVSNVTFANFDSSAQICIRACSHCKVLQGGFMYKFQGLTFLGKSSQHKAAFQWMHEVLLKDLDGSLTGIVGGTMLPISGLLPPDRCNLNVPDASHGAVPGAICNADVRFLRMAFNRVAPLGTFAGRDLLVNNTFSDSYSTANNTQPWRHYRLTHLDGYMFNLVSGYKHTIDFNAFPGRPGRADVEELSAGLYLVEQQDYVLIEQHIISPPDHFNIGNNQVDLGREPTAQDHHRSWHFDNTTNTLTYLLSGNATRSSDELLYKYTKEPCPIEGCPVPDGEGGPPEGFFRYWSNSAHWPTGRVPVSGQNVTILSRWKMIMDVTPPVLDRLNVLGHLEFKQANLNLTASTILVYGKNAKFIIGNATHRYKNNAIITLTGHRGIRSFALSRTMVVGAKALAIFGKLSLYGAQRSVTWTRLQSSARKGDSVISLTGKNVDWTGGDRLVIAASGYDAYEYDLVTVASVSFPSSSPGGLVQLTSPLKHDHLIEVFLSGTEQQSGHSAKNQWWRNAKMSPEVGLLTRNIRILGGEDSFQSISKDRFGCRVIVGSVRRGFSVYSGKAEINGVEFTNCGQSGLALKRDPRYAIVFKGIGDASRGSFVRNSAFHDIFNTALGIHLSKGITVQNNVVFNTVGSSLIIGGADNKVLSNVAILMKSVQGTAVSDNHVLDYPSNFEVGGLDNEVRDNAAGGSERVSFTHPGSACNSDGSPLTSSNAKFWGNTAHSGLLGLKVVGLAEECASVGGFTVSRHWDYGVFSWTASSLVITDVAIAVGRTGINSNIFGPDPVKHLFVDKTVKLQNSLIVGELPTEDACNTPRPLFAVPPSSFSFRNNKAGIMMSTFSKSRGKMDGTGPWHRPKSYPAVRGAVEVTDVAFARFSPPSSPLCVVGQFVVTNNPLSPDAMHPLRMQRSIRLDVHEDSLAFMFPPDKGWINQEDCVDMDCDGPKHSIIVDLDGTFTATANGRPGSIVPEAELRFDQNRLPIAFLADADTGILRSPADLSMLRGIARGAPGNLSASTGGCEWRPSLNSYKCSGLQHAMLVLENMDADSEVRRVSPVALRGGDTGQGKYVDLLNGPMDHGWCTYYTCLKRLSTFYSAVVLDTDYELWLTGSNPSQWRFHLISPKETDSISLKVWFKNIQRKDTYKHGIFIEPENVLATETFIDDKFIPNRATEIGGSNYFDVRKQFLHLVLKGSAAIEVITAPVVILSFNVQISLDDFFDPQHIVTNIASALGIDLDSVRLVDVIAEDSAISSSRRRRQAGASPQYQTIKVEIGSQAKDNRTASPMPSVSDQIASGNVNSDLDNIDLDANATADPNAVTGNSTTVPASSIVLKGANLTDSPTAADILSAIKDGGSIYTQQVDQYVDTVNATNYVNQLAATLVNKLLLGQLVFDNVTIVNASVNLAQPPPVPSLPSILPPSLSNISLPGLENITSTTIQPLVLPPVDFFPVTGPGSGGTEFPLSSALSFSIPTQLNLFNPPASKSGHLVYVVVEILDSNGQRSTGVGGVLGDKWIVTAALEPDRSEAKLEGQITASVTNGLASFTRLRVDKEAEQIWLRFTVSSGTLRDIHSGYFDIIPPAADVERSSFLLKLGGVFEDVVGDKLDLFSKAAIASLSSQLDIDPSRIQNLVVHQTPFQVSLQLLGVLNDTTVAPDVPSLAQVSVTLNSLISKGSLAVVWSGGNVTVIRATATTPAATTASQTTTYIIIGATCGGGLAILLLIFAFIYHGKKMSKENKVVDEFLLKSKSSTGQGLRQGPSTSSVTAVTSTQFSNPRALAPRYPDVREAGNDYASGFHSDVFFKATSAINHAGVADRLQIDVASKSVASLSDVSVDVKAVQSGSRHPLLQDSNDDLHGPQRRTGQLRSPLHDMDHLRAQSKASTSSQQSAASYTSSLPGGVDY